MNQIILKQQLNQQSTPKKNISLIDFPSAFDNSAYSVQDDPLIVLKYCKEYTQFIKYQKQIQQVKQEIQFLKRKINQFLQSSPKIKSTTHNKRKRSEQNQSSQKYNYKSNDQMKRRKRRQAGDIIRHFVCKVEGCEKSYGSQGSLNQHYKIKHPEVFKSLIGNEIHEINEDNDSQSALQDANQPIQEMK